MPAPLRVCVIGAGAGGLSCLRRLAEQPGEFEAIAFEQTAEVGGVWVYNDETDKDKDDLPVHSIMYKNLKTNLAKEVMYFPGFSFPLGLPSFVGHADILKYLQDFADHFDLHKFINFKHTVSHVCPTNERGAKWKVIVHPTANPEEKQEHFFDAVMVCNGHYAVPILPEYPGLEVFLGQVMHSKTYRTPNEFAGRRMLLIGGGPSGIDIAFDLAPYAKEITLLHRNNALFTQEYMPPNVTLCSKEIQEFTSNHAVFDDSSRLELNTVMMCTGYSYQFPFLSDECKLKNKDEYLRPLYRLLLHTRYPSLSFIGLPKYVVPFQLMDCQVRFALAVLKGKVNLPSEEEMNEESEAANKESVDNMPFKNALFLADKQFPYQDTLAELGGFEKTPKVVENIAACISMYRDYKFADFRKLQFEIINDEEFREVVPKNSN